MSNYNPANLTDSERIAILEYKVLALSLHLQRLESLLSTIITAGSGASLKQMQARLSEIDGLGAVLPIAKMTETKAREMLGDGPTPTRYGSIAELLTMDV